MKMTSFPITTRYNEPVESADMLDVIEAARQRKVDEDYDRVMDTLTEDELFEVGYIPFVISEIVWDYVDTIINYAIMLRQTETKKLTRELRALRREYDRRRFGVISDASRRNETDNMILFQEELGSFFTSMFDDYKRLITATYGDMEENRLWLVSSVFVCLTVLSGLTAYETIQRDRLSEILGYRCNHIVPEEMRALPQVVLKYAGAMRKPDGMDKAKERYEMDLVTHLPCEDKQGILGYG